MRFARLAECLIPLLADDQDEALEQAKKSLSAFADHFNSAYIGGLRRKVGLTIEQDGDASLSQDLLDRMAANKADFTLTFRRLATQPQAARPMKPCGASLRILPPTMSGLFGGISASAKSRRMAHSAKPQ